MTFATNNDWQKVTTKTPVSTFAYNNTIINPACVEKLSTNPANIFPTIASVDLTGCENSTKLVNPVFTNGKNYRYLIDPNNPTQGSFEYNVIGRTTNGLFVIETISHYAQRGKFSKIQIIKLSSDHVYHYRNPNPIGQSQSENKQLTLRPRELMTLVGEIEGAKGCGFGINSITVRGNTITIGFNLNQESLTALEKIYPIKPEKNPNTEKENACLGIAYFDYNLQNLGQPSFVKVVV